MDRYISVVGASTHNLRHISCSIPHGTLCCCTGVSGSGKSSFAFDTIFIEGQRRYIQALSRQAKRVIGALPKPKVESIAGLTPTIAVEQQLACGGPRSTVGTVTEIHEYLRVLFARAAAPYCPISHEPLTTQGQQEIIEQILTTKANRMASLLSPVLRQKKGELAAELSDLERAGFSRVRIDGEIMLISDSFGINPAEHHDLDVVIDRLEVSEDNRQRLTESILVALERSKGLLILLCPEEELFSQHGYSKKSGRSYPPLDPAHFSFNSPQGMCPSCQGLLQTPPCPACKGSRLAPYPAAARLWGETLHELCGKPIGTLEDFFSKNAPKVPNYAAEIIQQLLARLHFLQQVGLGYLSLDRPAATLSGGEFQRVRLAAHLGSSLSGVTYILDEPSVGLHPSDNKDLIQALQQLRDRGNTVIVVEHDEEMIRQADWIIDFGPGAGEKGGEVLFQGTVQQFCHCSDSITSQYLFGRTTPPHTGPRPPAEKALSILGICHRNLQHVDLHLPLERFVAITGVSGSGKSSLVLETIYPVLAHKLRPGSPPAEARYSDIQGHEFVDKILHIDQSPIGRTRRSNPATYVGVFEDIRALFASLPICKAKGWTASRFSFNTEGGVCPTCSGMGTTTIKMDFLEDAVVPCPTCHGNRFSQETLSVEYKGRNILQVLEMTCHEAMDFFASVPAIKRPLALLCSIGLEYIKLGQPTTTLSGGEAQRLKLAKELSSPATGRTLYLFDEPSTGLHIHDVSLLLKALQELVVRGNSVVVIEHLMELVKAADWVIDVGPGAGASGGRIIAEGTPERIAAQRTPTGLALKEAFSRKELPSAQLSPPPPPSTAISIQGAAQNTLKDLSFSIPTLKHTVLIGPSGSGKTSLAFDTLFCEGQRLYVESLSPYVRQYIRQMPRPNAHCITGLPPPIAVQLRGPSANPRSTVGTLTEIYEYLRILWARLGVAHCPKSGSVIRHIDADYVAQSILTRFPGEAVYILAPFPADTAKDLVAAGYSKAFVQGRIVELETLPPAPPSLSIVVDRLRLSLDERPRCVSSLEEAFRLGGFHCSVLRSNGEELPFSRAFASEQTGEVFPEITAQTFAFNTPQGMCFSCFGLSEECPACQGSRLNPLARHVTVKASSIFDFCRLSMDEARGWLSSLLPVEPSLERVFFEISYRLKMAQKLGIGYLSLSRGASSLSSGEAQRAKLISQVGSSLSGLLYIFEEPSTGLHPDDNVRLIGLLTSLRDLGNTIVSVEHDPQLIAASDHVIEFGPGGGKEGGFITFQGVVERFRQSSSSTAAQLAKRTGLSDTKTNRGKLFHIRDKSIRNFRNFSCDIPNNALVGITGVSGAGKSTLLLDIIAKEGLLPKMVLLDQQPIGRGARSDVVTWADLFTSLRTLYASLPQAKALGLTPTHFSPATKAGRCELCQGLGYQQINLHFLPTANVPCQQCNGLRLNPKALLVKFKGFSLGELLLLPLGDLVPLFPNHKKIQTILASLCALGLSYLRPGQEISSLSVGEARRIELAKELSKTSREPTLFLMDEPANGLHIAEVFALIDRLHSLRDEGHCIVLVEQHLHVLAACDYVLELGPGAGPDGGKLIAAGSPKELARASHSAIGRWLRHFPLGPA